MTEKVTIYRFRMYDMSSDEFRFSRRWGTREAIEAIRGAEVQLDTAVQVDASEISSDVPGLTNRGFNPLVSSGGFQTQVR